jgi:hypothetical protein
VLPPERRPGSEYLAWSAVRGLAMLFTEGPLRRLTSAERDVIGQRLLDMVEKGYSRGSFPAGWRRPEVDAEPTKRSDSRGGGQNAEQSQEHCIDRDSGTEGSNPAPSSGESANLGPAQRQMWLDQIVEENRGGRRIDPVEANDAAGEETADPVGYRPATPPTCDTPHL